MPIAHSDTILWRTVPRFVAVALDCCSAVGVPGSVCSHPGLSAATMIRHCHRHSRFIFSFYVSRPFFVTFVADDAGERLTVIIVTVPNRRRTALCIIVFYCSHSHTCASPSCCPLPVHPVHLTPPISNPHSSRTQSQSLRLRLSPLTSPRTRCIMTKPLTR